MTNVTKSLRVAALAVCGLLILLAIIGASYQAIETRADSRRFPPKGKLIDVGGYKLNINCTGRGSPTAILETGLTGLALSWRPVQLEIAQFTRVCSYGRAGYGWSDAGPMPRTSRQIATELHTLLLNAGERGPYVLVGHSSGGLNVRVYNGMYPDEVAGMVLVDATHEDTWREMPPDVRKWADDQSKSLPRSLQFRAVLLWFGIARFMERKQMEESAHLRLQPKYVYAVRSEYSNFDESASEVRAAGNLGSKPLIVLTAGKDAADPEHLPKGITKEDLKEYDHVWIDDLQVKESRLSTRGERIMVPDSDHMIPDERPDAVSSAVRRVWRAAKRVPSPG
jgi:pimeloyl-ACP methyl ester carboxylesterase